MQSVSILNWLFPLRHNPFQIGTKVVVHPNYHDSRLPVSSHFKSQTGKIIGIYQNKALVELPHSVWDSTTMRMVKSAWFQFESLTPI